MDILPITVYGDKILREKAKKIKAVDDDIIELISDMFTTMREANGVGLAANQVGSDKALFVIDISPVDGYEKNEPIVMINPEILVFSDSFTDYEEGCLSLPGIHASVTRPGEIKIKYLDANEQENIIDADRFFARVIQHEYDHLLGKMIPDRVTPADKKKMRDDLMRIMKRDIDPDYLITERGTSF